MCTPIDGLFMWHAKNPAGPAAYPVTRPAAGGDFSSPALRLRWQWNHNPLNEKWSLAARPGFLRLTAAPAADFGVAPPTHAEMNEPPLL